MGGQEISLPVLFFLVVTAFPTRLDESQPQRSWIPCLARGLHSLRWAAGRLKEVLVTAKVGGGNCWGREKKKRQLQDSIALPSWGGGLEGTALSLPPCT